MNGRIAYACISEEMLKRHDFDLKEDEGIIDILREIDTVIIAFLITKVKDGYKLSMRSKDSKPDPESCAHTFGNWQFAAVPTCTETGVRTRECSLCGKTEDEDMPAGLHTFDGRACSVCGESMTGMEFTSYGDGTCCVKDAGRVRGDMVIPNYSPEGDLAFLQAILFDFQHCFHYSPPGLRTYLLFGMEELDMP